MLNQSPGNPQSAGRSGGTDWQLVRRLLAIFLGAVSCMILAWRGFDLSIDAILEDLLGEWDKLLEIIFGWAARWLVQALNGLIALVHWPWVLTIHEHWRHVFIILLLYFFKDAAQFGELGLPKNMRTSYVAGCLVAVLSGIGSGLIDTASTRYLDQFLIGFIPIAGFFVYAIIMAYAAARWNRDYFAALHRRTQPEPFRPFFLHRVGLGATRALIATVILALGLRWISNRSPAIFLLGIIWCLLAVEWLRRGWLQARTRADTEHLPFKDALLKTGNINMGLDMLATVGLALAALALSVALSQ